MDARPGVGRADTGEDRREARGEAGETLVVYTERAAVAADDRLAADELPDVVAPKPDALPDVPGATSP